MNIILIIFAYKYKGDWDKIYKALEDKEKISLGNLTKFEEAFIEKGLDVITIIDKDYPEELKKTHKPPFVIARKNGYTLNEVEGEQASIDTSIFEDKDLQETLTKFTEE